MVLLNTQPICDHFYHAWATCGHQKLPQNHDSLNQSILGALNSTEGDFTCIEIVMGKTMMLAVHLPTCVTCAGN